MPSMPHKDSVALVTGAGNRIGAVLAEALAGRGHAVVIHYRHSAEGAAAVRDRIIAAGGRAETIRADLSERSERAGLIEAASHPFGPLDVLVNNASLYEPDSARDLDEALWDAHFAVHVEAPCFLARDFAAQLPRGRTGNVVHMIDERVLTPSPAYFSYALSKSALWTATRMLAQSLAPAVRVNAIGPGPVLPEASQSQEAFNASVDPLLLGSPPSAEGVAEALLFLLSAPAMTGQMLAIDAGRHLDFPERRAPTPRR